MKNLLFLLLSAIFILSCASKDGDQTQSSNNQLSFLDIKDAVYLYIEETNVKSKSSQVNTLFKVTTEGIIKEVIYTDDKGEIYKKSLIPKNIIKASDEYLIVVFDSEHYLVKKSDGAAYLLPIQEEGGFSRIDSEISLDSKGSMYFIIYNNNVGHRSIAKLDVSNPENLTYQTITPSHHNPIGFIIDKEDYVFYSGQTAPAGNNNSGEVYVLSKNGNIYKTYSYSYWKGGDGYCYIYVNNFKDNHLESKFEYDPSKPEGRYVYKVFVTASGLEKDFFLFDEGDYWGALDNQRYYIGEKLYAIDFNYDYRQKCKVFDITTKDNITSSVYSIPESFFPHSYDNKYVYSLPKDADFYRFNPESGDFKKLYTHNNDYEIYGDIKVKNGIITFTAFKLSENKNLMIEINGFDGEMRQTDLQSSNKCVVLEKIN